MSSALGLAPPTVFAQVPGEPAGLAISSWLEPVPRRGAGEDLAPPAEALPADVLVYSVRFTNLTRGLLDGVRITSPIPAASSYVVGSASGPAAEILFSVDGGRSFGAPSELMVQGVDGVRRAAGPADYTHVRWIVDGVLDTGAVGFVRFAVVSR